MIRITSLLRRQGRTLIMAAQDDAGTLEVHATTRLWEELRTEAPMPATPEDQEDYALGMLEHRASEATIEEVDGMRTVRLE